MGRKVSANEHDVARETMSIGELAQRTGVSPEAIRYYEREGVIPPATRTGAGSYRQYGTTDAERLRFVRRARDLGFSLEEVGELLTLASGDPTRPCGHINQIAHAHLAQVDSKLSQLRALRRELGRLIEACDRDAALADCSLLSALSAPD